MPKPSPMTPPSQKPSPTKVEQKPPRSTQYGRHPGPISHQDTASMRHHGAKQGAR